MNVIKNPSVVQRSIALTTAVIFLLFITFATYVYSEKRLDHANVQRQISFELADQLRHSSDDLTRMVRTYIATGDTRYKTYFQNILDIRNGKIARPENYTRIYWDLVLTGHAEAPLQVGEGVALLDLMRASGFKEQELEKLITSKANSDALTELEFEAIRLIEVGGPELENNRLKAIRMLHGETYHQAKSSIMLPINEFYIQMDERTAASIVLAKQTATALLWVFIALLLAAVYMLWRTYVATIETLGASVDEVHDYITRIGQGDRSISIPVHSRMENSVLAGLVEMQKRLEDHQRQTSIIQEELSDSKAKLNRLLNHLAEGVYEVDTSGNCTFVNQSFLTMLGFDSADEILGKNVHNLIHHHHPDGSVYPITECKIYQAYRSNQDINVTDEVFWRKDGSPVPIEYWSVPVTQNGELLGATVTFVDISSRKAAEAEIETLAFYDPLTKLPNRRLLMDRLEQALAISRRNKVEGALIFIDLDNFKTVNDTFGHDVGDQVLQQVSARLSKCIRAGDTVSRLGGDEFVIIIRDLSADSVQAASQAEATGKKILATLSAPYQLESSEWISSSSIGITLLNNSNSAADELMKQADIAMYQAKKSGRNNLRFFDPEMQLAIVTRSTIESKLRKALANQEFELYYQIQKNHYGKPIGAEALIRWIQPETGVVSPATFIPLAEETGMIIPIGQWVIESACKQIQSWQKSSTSKNLVLAINVSAKQFRHEGFIGQVKSGIQNHGIDPKLLKLELTESLMLDDIDEIITTMSAIKNMGVGFSLDDFGTGYSSLQYLKRLPIDQLKIDQTFIRDIADDENDRAIVKTIIAMAHSLNLEVIAEGVESEVQRKFLNENGCHHFQGYLLGRPVPIEEFNTSLE